MRLLYTAIQEDMTEILAREAAAYAQEGYRVFYLAPNSLSFEKEKKVLSLLPQQASFAITVTRFAQLARYLTLNESSQGQAIDDQGLTMIFYRVLSQLANGELQVYGRLKKDSGFIAQLVSLYKELQTANLSPLDLGAMADQTKQADLLKIFSGVAQILQETGFANQSKISQLGQVLKAGQFSQDLTKTVVVIDGYSRFSAEEAYLVDLLSQHCHELVIGVYISPKAYQTSYTFGNLYQASLDFIRDLARTYQTKPIFVSLGREETSFSRLTSLVEGCYDFSQGQASLSEKDRHHFQIWDCLSQKDELEHLARDIRQKIAQGYRYKDILVLLGDSQSYSLQLPRIFDKFDIPHYLGQAESMAHHPLVNFVEALERLKRYQFRAEDLLNLLKSGLYGNFSEEAVDRFERYLTYADIKGQAKFARDFYLNHQETYDLDALNQMRQAVMSPLLDLLNSRPQLGKNLLKKWQSFLEASQLTANLTLLCQGASQAEMDRHDQVWKTFVGILGQISLIFGQEKLAIEDFLSLLSSAMLGATYQTVPATVDVVSVKGYDFVEPHANKLVYAIGMTQSNFPMVLKNTSLLTDEDRGWINDSLSGLGRLDIASREQIPRNHSTALSLYNAASDLLVLSAPQLLNEGAENQSSYIRDLIELGLPVLEKGKVSLSHRSEAIGHYKDLLSSLLALNFGQLDQAMTKEDQTFWSVGTRLVKKYLKKEGHLVTYLEDDLATNPLSEAVLSLRYPEDQPLKLSVSALTTFYNNQYLYFLRYVLGLQEADSSRPDARHHGTYLHRIFERLLADQSDRDFDQKLTHALNQTRQEAVFAGLYEATAETRLSRELLEDIARSTATVLRNKNNLTVQEQEAYFDLKLGDQLKVTGIIDRVDRLADGSLGVVDYKSGKTKFDIQTFYNGLGSQLVTYLEALRQRDQLDLSQLFGAMYLHMQEPKLDLKTLPSFDGDKILAKLHGELTYKGLFLEGEKEHLASGQYSLKNALYTTEELETLLNYNRYLFEQARQAIARGHFQINPYSNDGKSVQGDQLKAITRFEADRHLGQARRLEILPSRERKENFLAIMREKGGGHD